MSRETEEDEPRYVEYADKIPKEVRLAIRGLHSDNELTYGIIIALIQGGEMQFSSLERELEVHSQSLSNALSSLETGGLIKKKPGEGGLGDNRGGNYSISQFGKKILDGLYDATESKYKRSIAHKQYKEINEYKGAKVRGYEGVEFNQNEKVGKQGINTGTGGTDTYGEGGLAS